MRYCAKHCYWFSEKKCPKCIAKEKPYLRTREEVADPNEWKLFKRRGWTR
ncbi:MAG: hypothetical protein ACTSUG_00280 [Candidatus Helarchaeota archaeon]